MARRVLVTGGAGFVGSHLVDALLARGDTVRIFDNLDPQVHGPARRRPAWLAADAEFVQADVRDADAVRRSLAGIDTVYHLAAAVGVGQSMYQVADYTAVNTLGTANLLQALVDERGAVERLVVASSMSIYGEGRYTRPDGREPRVSTRSLEQLRQHEWELCDPDGVELSPVPTDEGKALDSTSIYALTKADQERMVLMIGAAYGIPSVALRFFNIYGPRQALSNPYTGVAAIFSSRLLNGQPPLVYEDGEQRRDFVSVHDIVQALLLSAEEEAAVGKAFNVGSGRAVTVREVAGTLASVLGSEVKPEVTGKYRVGDIRNCYADISLAREVLGYEPRVSFREGMEELVGWLREQERPESTVEAHAAELAARGLTL
ncbi:NAD-dependent epimerase/dehydratase family protein [Longimicrobium sp.]|uniref:NAD-dependent epimerase/dehydratase family protein n=1 Tax=Longimicrobium sp. TaxID=2029185 RepID=UPI002C1A2E04|nr:NAD-dependent epimerase/dehydratase family protein [Longimicrobium sp.]HSU16439.1 NAD-dependent epimerase/dehydratase family protein [Longimicrobium sp.]